MIHSFYWQTTRGGVEFASSGRRVLLKAHAGRSTWSRGQRGNLRPSFHTPHPPPPLPHHHVLTPSPRYSHTSAASPCCFAPLEHVNSQPRRFSRRAAVCQTRRRLTGIVGKPWRKAKQHSHPGKSQEILITLRRRREIFRQQGVSVSMGNFNRRDSKALGIKHSDKMKSLLWTHISYIFFSHTIGK